MFKLSRHVKTPVRLTATSKMSSVFVLSFLCHHLWHHFLFSLRSPRTALSVPLDRKKLENLAQVCNERTLHLIPNITDFLVRHKTFQFAVAPAKIKSYLNNLVVFRSKSLFYLIFKVIADCILLLKQDLWLGVNSKHLCCLDFKDHFHLERCSLFLVSTDYWLGFGFFPPTFIPPDYIQIASFYLPLTS